VRGCRDACAWQVPSGSPAVMTHIGHERGEAEGLRLTIAIDKRSRSLSPGTGFMPKGHGRGIIAGQRLGVNVEPAIPSPGQAPRRAKRLTTLRLYLKKVTLAELMDRKAHDAATWASTSPAPA
jgi:hypothetical protein